eukprot:PhF_6_TR36208/c0_g1_i3/m.52835
MSSIGFVVLSLVAITAYAGDFNANGIEGELEAAARNGEYSTIHQIRKEAEKLGVVTRPGRLYDNWALEANLTTTPEQIHIGITNNVGNISVMWMTSLASVQSQVCWRPIGGGGSFTCAEGSSWTYNPVTVLPWTGTVHCGYMINLTPGHTYEYYVGDTTLHVFSNTTQFIVPDYANTSKEIFVALGGDMGTIQLFGWAVAKQMYEDYSTRFASNPFEAFWLIGDISYSTLDPPKLSFEFFWDMFFRQEESLASKIPMLASYGNHDFAGGDSAAYVNRFRMPDTPHGLQNYYWSYQHGPVYYISICTEMFLEPVRCDFSPGSPQYLWLIEQLESVDRTVTPWVVLAGHRPMYSSDTVTDSGPLQTYIEPLLIQYKVDLELAGHMHCTELSAPVANNTVNMTGVVKAPGDGNHWTYYNPSSPVHITVGTLGAIIRESFTEPRPQWSVFRNGTFTDNVYGYATLRANHSMMEITFLKQSTPGVPLWGVTLMKK